MKIKFSRLLEIYKGAEPSEAEIKEIFRTHAVYAITNDRLNMAYIGETDDIKFRFFEFWDPTRNHIDGSDAVITKVFESDYEGTYYELLEYDCDNQSREFYWHDWYRDNTNYMIISKPGRFTKDLNKDTKIVYKDGNRRRIDAEDLDHYLSEGWVHGLPKDWADKIGSKNKGRKRSNRTRKLISDALKGNKNNLGNKKSEETKKKLSESLKGKVRTEEQLKRLSEAERGKKHRWEYHRYQKPDGSIIIMRRNNATRYHPEFLDLGLEFVDDEDGKEMKRLHLEGKLLIDQSKILPQRLSLNASTLK